jgi:VWFA-related protein
MKANPLIRLGTGAAAFVMLALFALEYAWVKSALITPPPDSQPRQEISPRDQPKGQPGVLPQAPVVNIDVLVTDEDGFVLAGLNQANFRVLDNGQPQAITHFEPVGARITIVMLLEATSSAYSYFSYKSASWGSALLNYLEPEDYVALVTYDIKPTVRVDFTRNKPEVLQALSTSWYGQFRDSNLFDAVIDTLDRLDRVKGKTAIVIVGTGFNTMSQHNLGDTLKRIKESEAMIFAVGVAEGEYIWSGRSSITYLQSKNALQAFTELTGGMAWFPRFQGEIPGIFRSVATHLRNQYRIGFTPPESARDGKYHKLKVEVIGAEGKPLTVVNPKGKRRKVEVYARQGYMARGGDVGR